MPRIAYTPNLRFSQETLEILALANSILSRNYMDGFITTLRQLYYQFVKQNALPNTQQSYKRLGDIVQRGRMAGLLDWVHMEDRTRNLKKLPSWNSPSEIMESALQSYRFNMNKLQPVHIEVWIEKEALADVMRHACDPFYVPYFACRGYLSASEMWNAVHNRFLPAMEDDDKRIVIFYLGDHDPSGLDMTRDIPARIAEFLSHHLEDGITEHTLDEYGVEVRPLALNMAQITEQNLPPNPAKTTDARFKKYRSRYGSESWELDALDNHYLVDLVQEAILEELDQDILDEARKKEEADREKLRDMISMMRNME